MNDAYVGDIGDYGKYGLLRALHQETDFRLGIAWMKTATIRVFEYSETGELVDCDRKLHQILRPLVHSGIGTITGLEASDVLPRDTIYFNKLLDFRGKTVTRKKSFRTEWFSEAMSHLSDANLVFFDPDNGLAPPKQKRHTAKGPKYVWLDELKPFYKRGQSLVVYQHTTRPRGGFEEAIGQWASDLRKKLDCESIWALRWHKEVPRVYSLVPTSKHRGRMEKAVSSFEDSEWCQKDGLFTVRRFR